MSFIYDLRRLQDKQQLFDFLGISETIFNFIVKVDYQSKPSNEIFPKDAILEISIPPFIKHQIPKKNKSRGYRTVWEPVLFKPIYKMLGRTLGNFFANFLDDYPHPSVYGYLGGRNIRQNASVHCGRKFLYSTDIIDFFPSISLGMIERLFSDLGLKPEVSVPLARLLTIEGRLPLGLPTSPVISNAIFSGADQELQELANRIGAIYTRYSDDLSFSSNNNLNCSDEIARIVQIYGFRIAESKTKNSKIGQAHYVTGLSITDPNGPHVPRDKKRRLRQEIYYARKFGLYDHLQRLEITDAKARQQYVNRLDGLVKFVSYHEPRISHQIKTQWTEVLASENTRPSYGPRRQNRVPFCISIDEAEFQNSNEKILALGMAVSQHQNELIASASQVMKQWTSDLWAVGNREAIEKRGLHFVDASEDLRLKFIDRMRDLPFEGYVSLTQLRDTKNYQKYYLRLVDSIIKRRLMAAESQSVLVLIEDNEKVSKQSIRDVIYNAFEDLKASNNRRPLVIAVEFRSKPDLSTSYPDFLLGVLGRYLRSTDERPGMPIPRDRILFEKLRDKYRLILNVDTGVEFSRRRPIVPWVSDNTF